MIFILVIAVIVLFILFFHQQGLVSNLKNTINKHQAEIDSLHNKLNRNHSPKDENPAEKAKIAIDNLVTKKVKVDEVKKDEIKEEVKNSDSSGIANFVHNKSEKSTPPPPPVREEKTVTPPPPPKKVAQLQPPQKKTSLPSPVEERESNFTKTLKKLHLSPPENGAESLMAWWSTRIGIVLGIISAVFLGMYVNQNTGPLVRWCQLLVVSIGIFAGGLWIERRLPSFGKALTAGGLGMIFVSAFATYSLPAMKITDSAWVGATAQLSAVALICGWSLYRRSESIFSLALTLGYITCGFALNEGIAPLPYFTIVFLAICGPLMFILKRWKSGLIISLLGSSLGLIAHAALDPENSLAWGKVITAGALMTWFIGALGWRKKSPKSCSLANWLAPEWISAVWILVAIVCTKLYSLDLAWTYLGASLLACGIGTAWYSIFKTTSTRNKFWAKSSILLALFFIDYLQGPTRAYALLAQSGSLMVLARKEKSRIFEILASLGLVISYLLAKLDMGDFSRAATWESDDYFLLGYCLLGLGVVTGYAFLYRAYKEYDRTLLQFIFYLALSIELVFTGTFLVEYSWAFLLPLVVGALFLIPVRYSHLISPIGVPLVTIFGTGAYLLLSSFNGSLDWQYIVWVGFAWATVYIHYQRQDSLTKIPLEIISTLVLLFSVIHFAIFGAECLHLEKTLGLWVLFLALLWLFLAKITFLKVKHLSYLSIAPAALSVLISFIIPKPSFLIVFIFVIGMLSYSFIGWMHWRNKPSNAHHHVSMWSRMVLTLLSILLFLKVFNQINEGYLALGALMIGISAIFSAKFLKESVWNWMGVFYLFLAGYFVTRATGTPATFALIIVYLGYIFAGIYFSRNATASRLLSIPKLSSILWGVMSALLVFTTLARTNYWQNLTTGAWALAGMGLVVTGFGTNLRGYRVIGLVSLAAAIARLFLIDIQDSLWRIIGFAVTSAIFVGLGYVYNKYYKRLANGDLDWGKKEI